MSYEFGIRLHVGCMTLLKTIKHKAHHHPLEQVYKKHYSCKACRRELMNRASGGVFLYRCEQCDYCICIQCSIFKPTTLKHRWDPHSLQLIYHPGLVEEHEHEFSCEFCSEEIDTNYWFHHCSHCDLSFHESCSVLYHAWATDFNFLEWWTQFIYLITASLIKVIKN